MILILVVKQVFAVLWNFDRKWEIKKDTGALDLTILYINLTIEIAFNILLVYYQVSCNQRQASIA
jgi:hypothetical protein